MRSCSVIDPLAGPTLLMPSRYRTVARGSRNSQGGTRPTVTMRPLTFTERCLEWGSPNQAGEKMGIVERREKAKEALRTKIVEAARDIVSEEGLEAFSMRALA